MTSSSLSVKICIAESVEQLSEEECVNVLRLIQNELGHSTLNKTVTHMILKLKENLTKDSLNRIANKIKTTLNKKIAMATSKDSNKYGNGDKKDLLFALSRLPIDLLTKTSLFLNEKDIFQFERCCRLFYKMINNTSYLSKCNNFNTFTITKSKLNEMEQNNDCYFKYSKANRLVFDLPVEKHGNHVIVCTIILSLQIKIRMINHY